jgi:hypothetical protein
MAEEVVVAAVVRTRVLNLSAVVAEAGQEEPG